MKTLVTGSFPTSSDSTENRVASVEEKDADIQDANIIEETQKYELAASSSAQDVNLHNVLMHNLKFAFKPSKNPVEKLYK